MTGDVQAIVGAIDDQLAQIVGVGGLAVLADLLFHQLHDADGFVGSGVDHGERGIDGVADVQAVVGVIQHHSEGLALQRDGGFDGQGFRVQAQHLRRTGVITEAARGGNEHGVLLGAEGQLVEALGYGLALDRGGGGRGGSLLGGERGRRAKAQGDGDGQGGRADYGIAVHASFLVKGFGEKSLARVAADSGQPHNRKTWAGWLSLQSYQQHPVGRALSNSILLLLRHERSECRPSKSIQIDTVDVNSKNATPKTERRTQNVCLHLYPPRHI